MNDQQHYGNRSYGKLKRCAEDRKTGSCTGAKPAVKQIISKRKCHCNIANA